MPSVLMKWLVNLIVTEGQFMNVERFADFIGLLLLVAFFVPYVIRV
jgi:hypothetical protein